MFPCNHLRAAGHPRAVTAILLLLALAAGTSAVAGPDPTDDLTLAIGTVTQTSTTDFAAGTTAGTALSEADFEAASGQLRLDAPLTDLFLAPPLSALWDITTPSSGFTPVMENGTLDVQERDDSTYSLSTIESFATYTAGVVCETRARIEAGSRFVYLGFTSSTTSSGQWAYFGTRGSGDGLVPVIKTSVRDNGGGTVDVSTSATVGEWHVFRVEWMPGNIAFYIDDVLVDTRTGVDIDLPQHVGFYKSAGSDSALLIDWVRVTPYSGSPGSFESSVLDAGVAGATWLQLDWTGDEPAPAGVAFETRTGETEAVDGAWSVWSEVVGNVVANPVGRYAQYRATLSSSDLLVSPVVDEVHLTFNRLDIAPPNVVSVSPPDGAGGILPGTAVMASFDEALDPATITSASFTLTPAGGSPVPATVSYDETSFAVVLVPSGPLAHSTAHEARLTTTITDTDGNALAADHVWTFTTNDPDLTPPTVASTTPADGTQQILANRAVTAVFSEPLDPATITATSATLLAIGGSAVTATVGYDMGTATVTIDPDVDLAWAADYEARLTTAITDVAGNPLAADVVWTFRTRDDAPVCDVATASADFALGTATGLMITETDNSEAGGQLRLQGRLNDTFDSPVLASIWNPTNPEGYVPVIADGILDVQENEPDYDDRSSIESYEAWGPGVVFEARAMFVPGSAFIDIGFDANTNTNPQYAWFSSAGTGGMPGEEKIVARVREYDHDTVGIETGATYNEWHVFKIIWTQGQVEFFVDGALVATHTDVVITLPMHAAFYKTGSSETPLYIDWVRITPYTETQGTFESPVVDSGVPGTEWTDLSWLGTAPDPTAVSFATRTGATPVPDGTWSDWAGLDDGLVTSPPARYAQYRADLATTDDLESPVIDEVQLCRGDLPDLTPPMVTMTEPSDGAVGVLSTVVVSATFDEPLDAATITAASFTLTPQSGAPVAAAVGYDAVSDTATLTPDAALAYETAYTAELTTAVTDIAGNALESAVTWAFTTMAEPDLTPPTVASTDPVDGAIDVLTTAMVAAVFSEPLDPATVSAASFTLTPQGGVAVPADVVYDAVNWIATLTPQTELTEPTLYEARLTTAIADAAGNPLAADHVWTFTTAALPEVGHLVPVPGAVGPIPCGDVVTVDFRYVPSGFESGVRGYTVRVTATDEVTFEEADITVATLPVGATVHHEIETNGPNDYTVNYTILGADTDGIAAESDLFTIDFHTALDGVATIAITEADLRDLDNQSVPLDFSATGAITVDCRPPGAVAELVATHGHQLVTLTWQDAVDPLAASIAVMRCQWEDGAGASAYPRYGRIDGDVAPDRPATYEDAVADPRWSQVATVAPGVLTWVDAIAPRGIYAYEVYGLNGIGLSGPPAADAVVVTNYILGDVFADDGVVEILDVDAFAEAFGTEEGDPTFDAVMDFGPTDDVSGSGLPLPDGEVGFEDLIILGMNFGTGSAAEPAPARTIDPVVRFAWADLGAGRLALRLVEGRGIKAIRLRATTDLGGAINVTAGALLGEQDAPTFLRNAGPGLDAGFAVLGQDAGLVGTGELLLITGAAIGAEDIVLDVRGADGAPLEATLESVVTAVSAPDAFALVGNYPNPFNPSTTIRFALPEAAPVRLGIYGIDGRLIATLVDEVREAGLHDVVWRGQDDRGRTVSSGTYFYRFAAGGVHEVRKLVLLK